MRRSPLSHLFFGLIDAVGASSGIAWEIIVVDDASPDGTQEVAKQLAGIYGEDKVVCRIVSSE